MSRVVGKTKTSKAHDSGQRNHKKRVLAALPPHGVADMSMGGTDWHPMCLIRPGTKNVVMEATAEHFTKLFEIVSRHVDENAARQLAGVQTPTRKLRRRGSNPKAPRGPPDARELYIKTKGWVVKKMKDAPTPGSGGSGSSHKCSKNRRFLRSTAVVSLERRGRTQGECSGSRPHVSRRVSAANRKRSTATQVLSRDGPTDREDNDCSSTESNPFG